MLTQATVTTILPVIQMERAREFYQKKLGLTPKGFAADGNFLLACGGQAMIALIPKPQGTKAEHTALSFEVEDVEKEIRELTKRGVVFEEYD
ncbi:MAG: VOC family protein, partial [Burkholderiales bacterium]